MNTSKTILTTTLLATLLFAVGCQPAPNRETRRFGRTAFGASAVGPSSPNTAITYITNTGGDMFMSLMASQLAAPAIADQPQWSLGYVSASTGVKIWSESYIVRDGYTDSGAGTIDGNRSRIHIEVYDSKVGSDDGAGGTIKPFVLHIGNDQTGFEGATGGIVNGTANLTYNQSGYGYVAIRGAVSGSSFAGQVYFSNAHSGGEQLLGQFTVAACSFFVCQ